MQRADFLSLATKGLAALALSTALLPLAHAADKVRLGVFPSSAALPFYIAQNRGYFKAAGLEVEEIPMTSHPLTVQAIVAGNIDGAANLVTLEGANMESRRPNTLKYLSLNGQNSAHVIEQFVVKAGHPAKSLRDFKGGVKLFSAPGPANIGAARAVLKSVGLKEGSDFTIQEQPVNMHASVLQAGTFDGGYTLEPAATIMVGQKIGQRVEAGVIATHLLGNKNASAFAAGAVLADKFVSERPDVARRFAEAWARGVKEAQSDTSTRGYLIAGMKVPPELAATVPLPRIVMARDLSPADVGDFQKFLDLGVELGVIKDKVDGKALVKAF
ncbi:MULTISPECIES: ABC transporter substrate-binding protein [Hydrogenophaga]|uniref:ABC transporter substrate binding protein n=1 Tax=Hydrogenophaga intermedia TaxID=65786 RepID=A0A1L1PPW2_HYDIT|nr:MULTISPECIES: ABC transporter substrate-binding protein [Hydrogenophaga]AOS79336.1 ABC transporter substrate-binding protein [Hydrogenophaga sp. PBC]TMU72848.1 ABC transporter substrate-binding protein [Hydrogenophaga intermedia]CDN88957.1 ABC transporter substrate binding protein [Hydrogenophaga intermedia]